MSGLKIELKTDNAAFEDAGTGEECARILNDIAKLLANGFTEGRCADFNGNVVGSWKLTGKRHQGGERID